MSLTTAVPSPGRRSCGCWLNTVGSDVNLRPDWTAHVWQCHRPVAAQKCSTILIGKRQVRHKAQYQTDGQIPKNRCNRHIRTNSLSWNRLCAGTILKRGSVQDESARQRSSAFDLRPMLASRSSTVVSGSSVDLLFWARRTARINRLRCVCSMSMNSRT